MRHDPDARGILVDEDMVRPAVWAVIKYIFCFVHARVVGTVGSIIVLLGAVAIAAGLDRNGKEPFDNRIDKPWRQRGIDELITNQVGGPGL